MPNAGAEKLPSHLLLQSDQGKMAGSGAGQQKSSKSFSDLLLSLAAGGRLVFSFESSSLDFPNELEMLFPIRFSFDS